MKKFEGELYWLMDAQGTGMIQGGESGKVHRAILEDNIFTIDHTGDLGNIIIRLRSKDNYSFNGSGKYIDQALAPAVVNVTYYYNGNNAILIGDWIENKKEFLFLAKLNEVDSFKN